MNVVDGRRNGNTSKKTTLKKKKTACHSFLSCTDTLAKVLSCLNTFKQYKLLHINLNARRPSLPDSYSISHQIVDSLFQNFCNLTLKNKPTDFTIVIYS